MISQSFTLKRTQILSKITLLASLALSASNIVAQPSANSLDAYSRISVNAAISASSNAASLSEKLDVVSQTFLDVPYQANTMIGSANKPEQLVIDVKGLDCFTYLDNVAALHRASSADDYISKLINTRYINGEISFSNRKHFFTDWAHRRTVLADDITRALSPAAQTVIKQLNQKKDGSLYLPGIPIVKRAVHYIPTAQVNQSVINQLQTGDLVGIYTDLAGLDVTHVGFYINTAQGPVYRHASSKKAHPKVLDEPFLQYISSKPGIVVLRLRS